MVLFRRAIGFGFAVAIAVLTILLVGRQRTIRELRSEITSLKQQAGQAAQFAEASAQFSNQLALARAAQPAQAAPFAELLRLRGELAVMRRELEEARSGRNPAVSNGLAQAVKQARAEEALRMLERRRVEAQAELASTTTMLKQFQQLKASSPDELRLGIITSGGDKPMESLSEQLTLAREGLAAVERNRRPEDGEIQKRREQVEDLNEKMDERAQGFLLGLSAKADAYNRMLDELQTEAERIRQGSH